MPLTPTEISTLYRIFQAKGWHDLGSGGISNQRFEVFCNFLDNLNPNERELALRLTEDFIEIDMSEYVSHLKNAFESLDVSEIPPAMNVFIIPLMSPEDKRMGKAKSSTSLPYFFINNVVPTVKKLEMNKKESLTSEEPLNYRFADRGPSLIIALDDFIGTGDTCHKFIDEMENKYLKAEDMLVFISISVLEYGYKSIIERGYKLFYSVLQKRGISDSENINNKDDALEMIDEIEKRINVSPQYRRGYKKSEALIKLARTPNNTLPMYWTTKKVKGVTWPAPFPR